MNKDRSGEGLYKSLLREKALISNSPMGIACNSNGVALSIHFTTNAILLKHSIIDDLKEANIVMSAQVPFDGNEIYHNEIKSPKYGFNSYRKALDNVLYGVSKGYPFVIRCNCTSRNIDSFSELVDEFSNVSNRDLVVFSVQTVWQEEQTSEIRRKESDLYNYIFSKGFNKHKTFIPLPKCYADNRNSVVVNYDGRIFKCTANEFSPDNSEGLLGEDGQILFNERYAERVHVMYDTPACISCKLFPICNSA